MMPAGWPRAGRKCNTGAAAAIPVLEKALTDGGFKLPAKM